MDFITFVGYALTALMVLGALTVLLLELPTNKAIKAALYTAQFKEVKPYIDGPLQRDLLDEADLLIEQHRFITMPVGWILLSLLALVSSTVVIPNLWHHTLDPFNGITILFTVSSWMCIPRAAIIISGYKQRELWASYSVVLLEYAKVQVAKRVVRENTENPQIIAAADQLLSNYDDEELAGMEAAVYKWQKISREYENE